MRPPGLPRLRPVARALALVALLAAGCTQKIDITAPPTDTPGSYVLVTPDSVQAIYDASCSHCHYGATPLGGIALETAKRSYAYTVDFPAIQDASFLRIAPNDPANSYLLMKLTNDPRMLESLMPLGDPPLRPATIAVITNWVAQGARPDTVFVPALYAGNSR